MSTRRPPLETFDWSKPNELIADLKARLGSCDYIDPRNGPEIARVSKLLECIRNFKKRVKKSSGRFRHPSCRAVHALLAMGGYDRVGSMSCCGTYGANENPYAKLNIGYCGRRRFCASCAWWAGREFALKFLASFDANKDNIHAFTWSWHFPDKPAGIIVPMHQHIDDIDFGTMVNSIWVDWWEQRQLRRKEQKERREERVRKRKPLPENKIIAERFLESTLRCFALATPEFWEAASRRWFHYPSDFMGKLRLGQHLDSYEDVLAICKKIKFPIFKYGRVEVDFGDDTSNQRGTPDISFRLAETAEWNEAQGELRAYLGMDEAKIGPNPKAQTLIDFANTVERGREMEVPRELYRDWNYGDRATAVRLAQREVPRLYERREDYWNVKIVVGAKLNPLLSLPSLDVRLDLSGKPVKSDVDRASKRIEEIVKNEVHRGRSNDAGLVLARTTSRILAQTLFGYLNPDALAEVCAKLRPVGMTTWWDFPKGYMPWVFGVCPNAGLNWKDVVAQIDAEACKVANTAHDALPRSSSGVLYSDPGWMKFH